MEKLGKCREGEVQRLWRGKKRARLLLHGRSVLLAC
jgi:hypothetical protein